MKMKIFRLFMLPVAVFTLASAAAVSTDNSNQSKTASTPMTGYIHSPNIGDCKDVEVDCELSGANTCVENGWTVHLYDTAVTCNFVLKRP